MTKQQRSRDVTADIIGSSVRGPKHERTDNPCEDAFAKRTLSDRRYVIVVADGLGSRPLAHLGSQIAADAVADYLEEADPKPLNEETARESLRNAFVHTREVLSEKADEKGVKFGAGGTTLLAAIGGPSGVGGAAVGDGGIVWRRDGESDLLIPPEKSEYANGTTPVQSDNWDESYRFGWATDADAVSVFSDGIESFAWDGVESLSEELFDQLFESIYEYGDLDELEALLREDLLESSKFRDASEDDKTVVIGAVPASDWSVTDAEETETIDPHPQAFNWLQTESLTTAEANGEKQKSTSNQQKTTTDSAPVFDGSSFNPDSLPLTVTADGDRITLYSRVNTGDDRILVRTNPPGPRYVRLFDPESVDEETERRMRWLVENAGNQQYSIRRSTILWPSAAIKRDGQFLGVELPFDNQSRRTTNILERAKEFAEESSAEQVLGNIAAFSMSKLPAKVGLLSTRWETAYSLARAVDIVHSNGCAIGDLHHDSIRVTRKGRVTLLHAECFHIEDQGEYLPGASHDPRYAPPESLKQSVRSVQRGDRFALAVHLFQVLTGGHPFPPKNRNSSKPWAVNRQFLTDAVRNPTLSVGEFAMLPPEVKSLFDRCFRRGKTDPSVRPTPKEWAAAIK